MHLIRPAVAVVIVASAALATAASGAAPTALRLTDVEGDANGVNNQGVPNGPEADVAGPAQRAEADVLSLTLAPLRTGERCNGFTATIELAAPAGENMIYRVDGQGTSNHEQFWLEYDTNPVDTTTTIRSDNGEGSKDTVLAPAKLSGNTITITVTQADLKASGEKPARFTMYQPGVDVRTSVKEVTAPNWDTLEGDETKSFTPCR